MKTLDLNWRAVASIYLTLTQHKDTGAGSHCGHLVGSGALPGTLVVLGQRLQEQGAVGQDGVRSAPHQVHLERTKQRIPQNRLLKVQHGWNRQHTEVCWTKPFKWRPLYSQALSSSGPKIRNLKCSRCR